MAKANPCPTIDELAQRAEAMVPRLRERAEQAEESRRIPDETIDELRAAGLFRVFQPARYGGYEMDYGPTQLRLSSILGRACGSSAWVQSVVACHAWLLGMFDPAAQDAVWGETPDALIVTALSPSTGRGQPVDGGYRVDGQWQFASGVDACDWAILNVPLEAQDGAFRLCLLPRREWEVVDTWFPSGLRGSGSKDIRVREAFVAEHFALNPAGPPAQRPGAAINPLYIYRLPIQAVFPYNVAAPMLGIAHGVVDAFVEETARRPARAADVARQLRVAESSAEIAAAHALLAADADEIARLGHDGAPITTEHQLRWKRDLAYSAVLCTRAAQRLVLSLGAHGILDSPIHRGFRDLHTVSNHAGLSWDISGPAYGRFALGLT